MYHVVTARYAMLNLRRTYRDDLSVSILHDGLLVVAGSIVDRRLVYIHKVPTATIQIVALVLHRTLTQHYSKAMFAYGFVIGQGILHLPVDALVRALIGLCMLSFVIAREIVFRSHITVCTPEAEVCAVSEVILQIIPQLQVDRELRHKLVRPVLGSRNAQHGQWVVHLLIGTSHTRDCIIIAIGITQQFIGIALAGNISFCIVCIRILIGIIILLNHCRVSYRRSQCRRQIERTAED